VRFGHINDAADDEPVLELGITSEQSQIQRTLGTGVDERIVSINVLGDDLLALQPSSEPTRARAERRHRDADHRVQPAMGRWNQVVSADNAGMRKDTPAFCEGGIAHERPRVGRPDPKEGLTSRYEVGEVLGVNLGAGVADTGEIHADAALL
jgi:hypothetical protein